MMWVMTCYDWYHISDCMNEDVSRLLSNYAWALTYEQWDHVCECGGFYE